MKKLVFSFLVDFGYQKSVMQSIPLVKSIRKIEKIKGNGKIKIQDCEKEISSQIRRSIAAKTKLDKDYLITLDDLIYVRPGNGISPGNEELLVGKRTNKSIKKGQIILLNDINN